MKTKILCAIICLSVLCALCACGNSREDHLGLNDAVQTHTIVDNYGVTPSPTIAPVIRPSNAPVPSSMPAGIPTLSPTVMPTLPIVTKAPSTPPGAPIITPIPVNLPTATPYVDTSTPKITKNPTSETIDEGGRAVFIARADYAQGISWSIVSPDLNTVYDAKTAVYYFNGLVVEGANAEKLVLNNIPYAMNGWRARCTFTGASGKQIYSEMASVFVNKQDPLEVKGKQLSKNCQDTIKTYGTPYGFSTGEILDYTYSQTNRYSEFNISLVRGAVELKTLFRAFPDTNSYAPVSMMWTESGGYKNIYWFEPTSSTVWNTYLQNLNDIAAYYGVGAAGSGGLPAPIMPYATPAVQTPLPGILPSEPTNPGSSQGGGVIIIG